MKVPKMFKSSERYDAGVDVIYNDDSKLEYAPFIYATKASGDNGGDDEEGDEGMVVHLDNNLRSDVTYEQLENALNTGKIVYILGEGTSDNLIETYPMYLIMLNDDDSLQVRYSAYFTDLVVDTSSDNNIYSGAGQVVLIASSKNELMFIDSLT